jgi:cyclophilin family peptidyl-prolyl cis-trans isomerase
MNRAIASFLTACLVASLLIAGASARAEDQPCPCLGLSTRMPEGPMVNAEIVVGPFDLRRQYRSMEGPYVTKKFRVSDLLASKRVSVPEPMIKFVERGAGGASMAATPTKAADAGAPISDEAGKHSGTGPGAPTSSQMPLTSGRDSQSATRAPASSRQDGGTGPSMIAGSVKESGAGAVPGLVDTRDQKRELLWFKGISLQVLDESDKVLPTAEFICHLNLDVEQGFRNRAFPQAEHSGNGRLITLTQGQTDFFFPPGFAVPVASDEKWTFTFQAANRTTLEHRRIKHRCIITFVKDSELTQPVTALHWYNPYIVVALDSGPEKPSNGPEAHGPDCLAVSGGNTAPNATRDSDFFDQQGRRLSGHWEVPPGTAHYRSPIVDERDPGFASKRRRIHAVWTHLHPLCTNACLVECGPGKRRPVFSVTASTRTKPGLEIEHIDSVLSTKGIVLAPRRSYELAATYENTTGVAQDSMVALGVFCADEKFTRPHWVLTGEKDDLVACDGSDNSAGGGVFCGIKNLYQRAAVSMGREYPLFDPVSDGPLLAEPKTVELVTSAGKINLLLDPALAPQHATQMYRLFKAGIFNGTPISRFQPNYLVQTDVAESKANRGQRLSRDQVKLLRRLPLEVTAQEKGLTAHARGVLTMARWDDVNSAVSSFSILLGDAPHLDNNYTIFGHVADDPVTRETLERIARDWPARRPVILSAAEAPALAAR